jgi:hypothetical protein
MQCYLYNTCQTDKSRSLDLVLTGGHFDLFVHVRLVFIRRTMRPKEVESALLEWPHRGLLHSRRLCVLCWIRDGVFAAGKVTLVMEGFCRYVVCSVIWNLCLSHYIK